VPPEANTQSWLCAILPGGKGTLPPEAFNKFAPFSLKSSTNSPIQNIILITLAFIVLSPFNIVSNFGLARRISRHWFLPGFAAQPAGEK
jgi:hypothetical protein